MRTPGALYDQTKAWGRLEYEGVVVIAPDKERREAFFREVQEEARRGAMYDCLNAVLEDSDGYATKAASAIRSLIEKEVTQ